jgi:HlyD family secretion protein
MKYLNKIWIVSLLVLAGCGDEAKTTDSEVVSDVVAQGELISLKSATVGPPNIRRMWQFKIQRLAPENSIVKKGDVIAVFDGQRLRTDLISRQSELEGEIKKAESEKLTDEATEQELVLALAEAEMNFEKAQRKVEIIDASLSTIEKRKQQADYEINKARLAMAKQKLNYHREAMQLNQEVAAARVKMKQSRVNVLKQDMAKLQVKAPKDGLVMYLANWNGDKPAVGETIYMGQPLLELPSLTSMALKAEFTEPDSSKVAIDQDVKVTFEAYPEKSYQGKVTSLGSAYRPKSSTNQKIVFDAIISLEGLSEDIIRPGMKAKVEVISS